MKIGLLNVRVENENIPIFLPSSLDYIASYLKAKNPQYELIIDYNPQRLIKQKPDIIGLSAFTVTYPLACHIAEYIKKYLDIPIIIGGHHITALPETLPNSIDVGVIGEGEQTFFELIELFSKSEFNKENLLKIDGLVFKNKSGNFIKTAKRVLIKDIDILPIPSRVIVPNIKANWQHSIFTSRGCPYTCKYCSNSSFWGKIRFHSVERVITELSNLVAENNQKNLYVTIQDDLFSINKSRLEDIVKAIKKEKLNEKITFTCNARANLFDREICQLFKEMNIKAVVFGMESSNDRILDYMKGSSSSKQNQDAIDICKENNIMCIPNFIVGFPSETKEEASNSYWFIRKNLDKVSEVRVFPSTPLPNTYLWDYGLSQNLIPSDFDDWESLDLRYIPNKSIYLNKEYSKQDYQNILSEFYNITSSVNFELSQKDYLEKSNYNEFISNILSKYIKSLNLKDILEINSTNIKNNKIDFDKTKKFDSIFILHSLELLKDPKKELKVLKKQLKPDGTLFLVWYNSQNPLFLLKLLKDYPVSTWGLFDKKNIFFLSEKIIKTFADDLNLNIIQNIKIPLNLAQFENDEFLQIKNILKKYYFIPDKHFISCITILK